MTPTEIRSRFERLRSQRRTIETTWEIIERFCAPYRGEMFRDQQSEHEIDWRRREVYDTTAIMAVQNLAASVHGGMTNPKIKWFDLAFRESEIEKDAEAQAWLEECGNRVHLALQESDFDLEINEAYIDLTSFGTSVLVEEVVNEEVWEGIDFSAVPVKEIFFEMDHKDQVLRLYRRLQWTATQILDKFGPEGLPEDIKSQADNPSSVDQKEEIIFCIYPRKNKKASDISKPLAPTERPLASKYIRHKDATMLGKEGGYYEMPAFVTRWRKTSESQWGNSPAMIALADVLTLNQLIEIDLRAREKACDPPILTTERGLVGDLDLDPAGLTIVRSLDEIRPWDSGAKFDATNDLIARLQQQIKEVFFLDKLDLKESPEMTATEVIERTERMHRLLGPTVGRLQNDLLDPLIQRTFNILMRAGQLPEMPEILVQTDASMDIEYLGPLARAQKTDTVQAIERFIQGVIGLAEVDPGVLDRVDFDAAVLASHKSLNIPAALLRGEAEVTKIRKAKAEQQAQQQELDQKQQQADSLKSMGQGMGAMGNADPAMLEAVGAAAAGEGEPPGLEVIEGGA